MIFVRSSLRSYFPTLENPASTDFAAFCRIKKEPGFGLGWRGSRPPAAERTPSEPRKSEKMRTFENLKKRGPANEARANREKQAPREFIDTITRAGKFRWLPPSGNFPIFPKRLTRGVADLSRRAPQNRKAVWCVCHRGGNDWLRPAAMRTFGQKCP